MNGLFWYPNRWGRHFFPRAKPTNRIRVSVCLFWCNSNVVISPPKLGKIPILNIFQLMFIKWVEAFHGSFSTSMFEDPPNYHPGCVDFRDFSKIGAHQRLNRQFRTHRFPLHNTFQNTCKFCMKLSTPFIDRSWNWSKLCLETWPQKAPKILYRRRVVGAVGWGRETKRHFVAWKTEKSTAEGEELKTIPSGKLT